MKLTLANKIDIYAFNVVDLGHHYVGPPAGGPAMIVTQVDYENGVVTLRPARRGELLVRRWRARLRRLSAAVKLWWHSWK